jgi:iron complex outermembrane recepter protein
MKIRPHLLRLGCGIAALLFLPCHLPAAGAAGTAAGGTLTGRVQNAATGQFLNNARVVVHGADLVAFTDETGRYVISNVPAGTITVEAFYTGLDRQLQTVTIAPGQRTTSLDFEMVSALRHVELDPFVVASSRFMDTSMLAINEQRFAANLINVVSTEAHGDLIGGNVGELVKFMPGVTAVIGGSGEVGEVSVRGFSTHLTNVEMDGAQVGQAQTLSNTRGFEFKGINVAAISRVEVSKVPLPSSRADSLSGSVNMVTKSAFDRRDPEIRYRTYMAFNSEWLSLRRQPFPFETMVYKAQPGFDVTYTKPVNQNLGFVLTAAHNRAYNPQNIEQYTWRATVSGTPANPVTAATPYFQQYAFFRAPKVQVRQSASAKMDWRIHEHGTLSLSVLSSRFRDDNANFSWVFNAGTNATPTPSSGSGLTFTPDRTEGATGRGSVTLGSAHHHYTQRKLTENIRYVYDDGAWRVRALGSHSHSTTKQNHMDRFGDFHGLARTLNQPVRVVFDGTGSGGRPASIHAINNAGVEIDVHDQNSYDLNTASSSPMRDIADTVRTLDLGVERSLAFLPVPASIEIGGSYRDQDRDNRRPSYNWTYSPADGNRSPARFESRVYSSQSPLDPGRNAPWASPRRAYSAWKDDPSLFVQTPAQLAAAHVSEVTTSSRFKEAVSAGYFQARAKFLESRLGMVTGVRYEETRTRGVGPLIDPAAVWVRNPDGTFARNPNGSRIRKPEAGAVNSLDERRLTHIERGTSGSRSYDGFYPSIHLTYNIRPNFLARLAYARSYGRPDFTQIVPNSQIDEEDIDFASDPDSVRGRIDISNPGLRPWRANNYDLSLEYYTDQGGLFTAGVFRKDITDFFGAIAKLATAEDLAIYGLDPRFVGWTLRTTTNVQENVRISGLELSARHSLAFMGGWGRHFDVFINGTKLKLEGEDAADWRGFTPETLKWGVTYSRRPLMILLQWVHQGESSLQPIATMGPGAFRYLQPRTIMDANIEYVLSEKFSIFANGRNVLDAARVLHDYGPDTPGYARLRERQTNGSAISIGLKGRF